jgi:hypothetical protein
VQISGRVTIICSYELQTSNKSKEQSKPHVLLQCRLHVTLQILISYTVSRTPWTGDQPIARPLPAHRTARTNNNHTQTSIPQVGFEPTIPVFERAKTVRVSDRTATVIGHYKYSGTIRIILFSNQVNVHFMIIIFSDFY